MKIKTVLIAKRISKVIESNGHLRMTFYDYLPKYICKWFEAFGPLRYLNYISTILRNTSVRTRVNNLL